jgi:hypothetical protein
VLRAQKGPDRYQFSEDHPSDLLQKSRAEGAARNASRGTTRGLVMPSTTIDVIMPIAMSISRLRRRIDKKYVQRAITVPTSSSISGLSVSPVCEHTFVALIDLPSEVRDVGAVAESLRALVAGLEPDDVFVFDAPELWSAFNEVKTLASAAMTLLARRVEDACTWKRAGYRSAAEQLASVSGTSVSAAKRVLETSKQVRDLPATAHAFDALIELARRASGAGDERGNKKASPRFFGLIRVDLESLRRGSVEEDETCEISGLGPIPVSVARRLLGDAVLKLVITKGVDVLNVTHLGRSATAAQKAALWWRSPSCQVLDCTRTQRLEDDHHLGWAKTHRTRLDELKRLCDHHHDLKTYDGWELIAGDGPPPMVPPDDPRHPKYRAPPDP